MPSPGQKVVSCLKYRKEEHHPTQWCEICEVALVREKTDRSDLQDRHNASSLTDLEGIAPVSAKQAKESGSSPNCADIFFPQPVRFVFNPLFLHVFEVDFQCPNRNMDFQDRDAERSDQQEQSETENVGRGQIESDVDEKHGYNAKKQTGNTQKLHGSGKLETQAQIVNLCAGDFGRILDVLFLQIADELRIREEPVGVSQ